MANLNEVRNAFGMGGDFSQELADIFGDSYLDGPDDAKRVYLGNLDSVQAFDISGILGRKIESTPEIMCQQNQTILQQFLNGESKSINELFGTFLHSEKCLDKKCQRLQEIVNMDKYVSLEELKTMAEGEGLL
jgi:hypothetical protein